MGGGAVEAPNQPWMTIALRLTTHKHTPLCIHYGLWENERNTCIFQLHRTFISDVRLTSSFKEEKERKNIVLFLDDGVLQPEGG